ncbi:two-component system histidine kinase PnpS [Gracilibacillus alcaliphilus]|uniref:two-component system histidine kinase PnpS n=1 Tax=Gracilibacillus alcaliphilus TaxID=1401441 RepID=UPI00195B6A62|nr:ATP-binding protein [Gracilibacillus alcaliphilus]MBM7676911.1 two-component system phosphate regulon sensor histidine kinase PhoR [Gracilibacillus alcaliphilus]
MNIEKKHTLFLRYMAIIALIFIFIGMIILQFSSTEEKLIVLFSLTIGYIILAVMVYSIYVNYVRPIQSILTTAKELTNRNYNARIYVPSYGDAQLLGNAVNTLARHLQEISIEQKVQASEWKTVMDNMESGLMLIDERGYVHLVNRKFSEMFGYSPNDCVGYLYYNVLTDKDIHKVVKETFLYEEKMKNSITHIMNGETQYIEIVGAPVINEAKELKGSVLVFYDITKLKRVEQVRKDFVANVSHELKTPITSIKGFAETLLDEEITDKETQKQFLSIILKESSRLQSLIHDLLELSQIEKDELQLSMKWIEAEEWLTTSVSLIEQQANKKQLQFEIYLEDKLAFYGDPDLLQQVVLNLMYNAVNYTPEQGKVTLRLYRDQDYTVIEAVDTGIGIPSEALPRLFERFYRVDRARSRSTGGTGLGLAIVKHIVEAHHGHITVESELGKGSCFRVVIPDKW